MRWRCVNGHDLCRQMRFVECPACLGERGFEVFTGYDPRDGSPTGWIERCSYCDGRGEVQEEARLIDEDEIAERDAAEWERS